MSQACNCPCCETARMAQRETEWADRPTSDDDDIKAVFPTRSGRHDLYAEAQRLVHDRHGKFAIVAMVNWLLHRIETMYQSGTNAARVDAMKAAPMPRAAAGRLSPEALAEIERHAIERKTMEFTKYRRSQIAELRPFVVGEALPARVSISAADKDAGSPKLGDMIARNPANHDDQWLVAADYFAANFEPA